MVDRTGRQADLGIAYTWHAQVNKDDGRRWADRQIDGQTDGRVKADVDVDVGVGV